MLRTLTSCQAIRLQPDLISWNAVCSAAEKCSKWNQESTHGKDWNMASKASWTGNILYELSESAGWQSLVVKNTTSGPYDLWILMTCFADARHTTLHSSEINITHIRITVICSLEVLCCLRRVCISIPLCTDFVCIAVVGILFARTFRTLAFLLLFATAGLYSSVATTTSCIDSRCLLLWGRLLCCRSSSLGSCRATPMCHADGGFGSRSLAVSLCHCVMHLPLHIIAPFNCNHCNHCTILKYL